MTRLGFTLKAAIFATGSAGMVAEFVLSTLATYLLGNAVFQWTIIMSLMLFAMGVGSRISKHFDTALLDTFVLTEFALSILCAASAILAYSVVAYSAYTGLVIYTLSIAIGVLIGFEIPLVTRINREYEELRFNIASVMEKDYYGSLVGGLFFAFIALPHIGLTYTPIILGSLNFCVASFFIIFFFYRIKQKKIISTAFAGCALVLVMLTVSAKPIMLFSEQRLYKDKVIYVEQSHYQKIVVTQWKKDYWLFINGQQQFSTYDEEKYHEPLVHPAMRLSNQRRAVLILGGGDGLALREVLKYKDVHGVTLVDIDPSMTAFASRNPILAKINQGAMQDKRVQIVNADAGVYLQKDDRIYNIIIIDLPDPDTVDLMHLYSRRFYGLVKKHLTADGVMVTQAASPYFARQAFCSILKTVAAAGLSPLPYHNHIPTMGEWGWVLAMKAEAMPPSKLKKRLQRLDFDGLDTRFLNTAAVTAMIHFGKGVLEKQQLDDIEINTELNPVLVRYYRNGSWGVY
jgi:spermidine synthase